VQDPDLLLLDEPTNHVDLDTIEWLESYLKTQDVPMVIISHDRAFLDQLCTKIVETEFGVSKTYKGNYSEYILAKAIAVEAQYAAWEKQQKEIEQTKELINRLGAGVNAGRASSEQKVTWIFYGSFRQIFVTNRIAFSSCYFVCFYLHFCVTSNFYLI
jgi:ATPase subunit of ABC transporter with duplicated ATPase domains